MIPEVYNFIHLFMVACYNPAYGKDEGDNTRGTHEEGGTRRLP